MAYKFPSLPANQRWKVTSSLNTFLIVRLQEKRWWGWKTIASSTGVLAGGAHELAECVDHIVKRDYYEMISREAAEQRRKEYQAIPFGIHQSKD
jgi:hypothetical protein